MLNMLYNIGIFVSVMAGVYAFDRRNIILILLCIFALVFFVMQKYKFLKEVRNNSKSK
jgi:hypothetical protein